jgi:hypothetical protein
VAFGGRHDYVWCRRIAVSFDQYNIKLLGNSTRRSIRLVAGFDGCSCPLAELPGFLVVGGLRKRCRSDGGWREAKKGGEKENKQEGKGREKEGDQTTSNADSKGRHGLVSAEERGCE